MESSTNAISNLISIPEVGSAGMLNVPRKVRTATKRNPKASAAELAAEAATASADVAPAEKKSASASAAETVAASHECFVCCEPFTKTRTLIDCPFCSFISCSKCAERYLLSVPQAQCMNPECGKQWAPSVLRSRFTHTFVTKKYRAHHEEVLFEMEKSMMPATALIVEARNIEKSVKHRVDEVMKQCKSISTVMRTLNSDISSEIPLLFDNDMHNQAHFSAERMQQTRENQKRAYVLLDKYAAMLSQIEDIHAKFSEEVRQMDWMHNWVERDAHQEETAAKEKVVPFVRCCPRESCSGYLNPLGVCACCNLHSCKRCFETLYAPPENGLPTEKEMEKRVKEAKAAHTCNEDVVNTITELKKQSKSCPKCHALISKIDGCDQMWCTQCHTAFSWRTGEIVKGKGIHNPHYFEWMRRRSPNGEIPRTEGDEGPEGRGGAVVNVCNMNVWDRAFQNEITQMLTRLCYRFNIILSTDEERLMGMLQQIAHNHEIVDHDPRQGILLTNEAFYRPSPDANPFAYNLNKRIEVLERKLDEKAFKAYLHNTSVKYERASEYVSILEFSCIAANDIFTRLYNQFMRSLVRSFYEVYDKTKQQRLKWKAHCARYPHRLGETISKPDKIQTMINDALKTAVTLDDIPITTLQTIVTFITKTTFWEYAEHVSKKTADMFDGYSKTMWDLCNERMGELMDMEPYWMELNELILACNERFAEVAKMYKTKPFVLTDRMECVRVSAVAHKNLRTTKRGGRGGRAHQPASYSDSDESSVSSNDASSVSSNESELS